MSGELKRPWLVLFGLALGVTVTNGFARFAYGLILPAMKAELGWTYAQAGWLNTVNALGYLGGAVLTMVLIGRIGPSRLFSFGLVTTAVALFATGQDEAMWWQTLWRILAGLFGAMSFSTAGALTAQLFQTEPRKNALAIALLFGFGGGAGIVLAGAVLPLMIGAWGNGSWPWAWTLIGLACFAMLPLSLWAARAVHVPPPKEHRAAPLPLRGMLGEMAGYAGFGLGYIVYFTFLSAWMTEQGAGPPLIASVWVMLGICLCVSPFVWRPVFARFASGMPLAMVLTGIAIGSVLPVILPNALGLVLSAAIFGLSVFMSPGAVTNFVRRNLDPAAWGRAISLYTVIFAVAQTVGPYAAGWLGDLAGGIGVSLVAAAVILMAGAVCALLQRPLSQPA
ncbi:YbfB/YjiJ family MFS transporter [Seohaeicola zhoushanensis]|uniref:MFS transporter n=1 Tax=Seohaeicola zhoushanensis TaxID=1569283 RepID=A0A8J3M4U6_9RHOB|nr:YbfB/YjiJ family MFS transporter [Seohaeicola zhoushanensis]GHF40307.1 MFS transporter [Seohaeicola zhoushanensis]